MYAHRVSGAEKDKQTQGQTDRRTRRETHIKWQRQRDRDFETYR